MKFLRWEDHGPKHYLLNEDHSLRLVPFEEWMYEFETADKRVAFTGNATKYVSTVFLGLDHRFFGDGPPLVFETMVFVDEGRSFELHGETHFYHTSLDHERYGSWAAAEAGHKRLVKKYLINQETRAMREAE
jgi:hypothetical protein